MKQQRIFITGGASGLGQALALRYARAQWSVCIGDIHQERGEAVLAALKELTGQAHFVRCDVRRDEDLHQANQWLTEHWGGVDVVVNNAGVADAGFFGDKTMADWQWIIDINLLGVVRGCRVFLPTLRQQGAGQFINIASAAGLIHLPRMSSYNTVKAAVVAFSESLYFELAAEKIAVSVVCPSFFHSNLADSIRHTDASTAEAAKHYIAHSKVGADRIAESIFQGAARQDFMIIPSRDAWWGRALKRFVPFKLYAKLLHWQYQRSSQSL